MTVDVSGVTVRLGGVAVLDDVDLAIDDGAFLGLVGPNGAGKTTLLQTVSATRTPDSGTVRVDGDDVHALSSRAASRRVATVPQETSIAFDFSVRELVEMGRHPHRPRFGADPDPGRVDDAMARTQVDHFADRPVSAVSGGERQRVLIARALAQDAPVLLLDEPTASLDINHQVRTLELVRELVDEAGTTVVAAIHDLNLAARYCDELALLSDGGLVDTGDPASVLSADTVGEAFGANAVVSRHPVTGATQVTALPDAPADRNLHVHVLGGGATPFLADLVDAGFEVTVGVVPRDGRDHETARTLGLDAVTSPPFEPVRDDALVAAREHVRAADVTVVPDLDLTAGARSNLELARESDALVVVDGADADDADDATRNAHEALRRRAVVVGTDSVRSGVERALVQEFAPAEVESAPPAGD
ncbi:ATP-binding cassette domain-containing protein [Halobacteriaceae archaeon GCM10025711]